MGYSGIVLVSFVVLALVSQVAIGDPIVPALIIFGDSIVDVGNNNNLPTTIKANFPPYGRDFVTRRPTGRFSNGKLAIDFTADYLGFTSYPPAYLSQEASDNATILTGANFASAGSGYYYGTPRLYGAVALSQQLTYFREYQDRLINNVGRSRAIDLLSGSIYLLSAGTSDYIQNYYISPALRAVYNLDQYSTNLMASYSEFIQSLYGMGARRIGVTNLPPMGCLPAAISLFAPGTNDCIPRLNVDALLFNNKLNNTSQDLTNKLPGLKLVVFDIYQPLLDMITKPNDNGFFEARRACCGTGTVETSLLCNARVVGTCMNATEYVFWDGFHPSEAANQVLAGNILAQGIPLIS